MGTFYLFLAFVSSIAAVASFGTLIFARRKKRSMIVLAFSICTMLVASVLFVPYAPAPVVAQQPVIPASAVEETKKTASPEETKKIEAQAAITSVPQEKSLTDFPDPILEADPPGAVICDTEEQLEAWTRRRTTTNMGSDQARSEPEGCGRISGRHVAKVFKIDGSYVRVKISDSARGDEPGFVSYDDLSAPDADQRKRALSTYQVSEDATVLCRRTTDFDEAMEAAKQLDVQWFRTSSSCKIAHKGDRLFMLKMDAPYAKVCIGSTSDCFLGWIPFSSIEEIKPIPSVLARGLLKICWPFDLGADERPADLVIPKGVLFLDGGEEGKEHNGDRGRDGTIVTTKQVLLKKSAQCVAAPASLLDDPDATWDRPVVRQATVGAKRFYVPDSILTPNAAQRQPLPDNFSFTPLGYIGSDFK